MANRISRTEFLGVAGASLAGMAIGRNVDAATTSNPIVIENAKPRTTPDTQGVSNMTIYQDPVAPTSSRPVACNGRGGWTICSRVGAMQMW